MYVPKGWGEEPSLLDHYACDTVLGFCYSPTWLLGANLQGYKM